jgi:CDGSH-type Zn-finger protein
MSESATEPLVAIKATHNGPYEVTGEVQVLAADGTVLRETSKAFLCRCGHSQNKPFCDGHHRRLDWQEVEPDAAPA